MFSLSTFSLLAFGPIAGILAMPTTSPQSISAPATKALNTRDLVPLPASVVQITHGLNIDGALASAWNAANNWTGPASWDANFCTCDNSAPAFQWFITIPNDNTFEKGGCGEGFLDNFLGSCGVISNWQCQYVGAQGTTAAMYFATTVACTLSDATDVIDAASYGAIPSMQCAYTEDEGGDVGRDMPFGGDGSDDPAIIEGGDTVGEGDVDP